MRNILVAVDESDAARRAVELALELAGRGGARLTALTVVWPGGAAGIDRTAVPLGEAGPRGRVLGWLERWLAPSLEGRGTGVPVELAAASGLPGIEIPRFAERAAADLVVLGRKRRTLSQRLATGDTADAVGRRSPVPCLFVPAVSAPRLRRVLAALDGTERGWRVYLAARRFADAVGAELRGVTVEPLRDDEASLLAPPVPAGRSLQLAAALERDWPAGGGAGPGLPATACPLTVRRGEPVAQILAEVEAGEADVLAIGYRRGGAPGVIEAGSVARRLAHATPCPVLTEPF
ncbi:MAG TPA: universal stress protein [Gemmatimonadales bacterium]|nr:universal stress protein [Gemmatimonadales bacterium]